MKHKIVIVFLFAFVWSCQPKEEKPLIKKVEHALDVATQQSLKMAETLKNKTGKLPVTFNEKGELVTNTSGWWTAGFFPGVLWYLYENSSDSSLLKYAQEYTQRVEQEKYRTWDHDIGFIIFCSFGNGYRITKDTAYLEVIETAAKSLESRFNPTIGCTRSWDKANWNKQWQYPVIIDNMMNLELLMWSAKQFGQLHFADAAIAHANTTMRNHYRPDYSSFHVVSYDTISGKPELKHTSQGYSNESAWARGQAWGLYGYTVMYRESKDRHYLEQAQHIADFILSHPNLPEDKIPYWDFNAPDIPNALRDASAGAIMASALLELSTFVEGNDAERYRRVAEKQIETLCSDKYLAKVGENGNFILKHGVGHMPNRTEVDVPLTYADYYFVEALLRYKQL